MPVRSGGDVARLLAALQQPDAIAREAAVARLRVLGARAVDGLFQLVASAGDPAARAAALQTLEGMDDPRIPAAALPRLTDPDAAVRVAAVAVLRTWLPREAGTAILEALAAAALDRDQDAGVRLAALDALSELPRHLVAPILEQAPPVAAIADPLADPAALREWLADRADAPLSTLHDAIGRIKEQERGEASARRRQDWLAARGAVHAALARRGSRVALYDLRETFDAAQAPLPLDFLTAITAIGDAECLEPLARAWRAVPSDRWWRERLVEAAQEIVQRLRLTGRSAAVKRVRARYEGFLG